MPGTRYDKDLDDWIIRILLDSRHLELRHNQLKRELNLQYKVVSTATFSCHLKRLWGGEILHIRFEKNGHTHFSLTKGFMDVLESERRHDSTKYLENTFSRFDRTYRRSFHKEVSPMDYHSGNYRIGRKRETKVKP